jgi:ribulose-phosphate 3-epimerase
VVLNPHSHEGSIVYALELCDQVLIMSVNPGFGGQAFIPAAVEKVAQVKALVAGRPIDIEVDGGVTPETVTKIAAAGANAFVAGSAVFKGGDYKGNIAAIRKAAATARGEVI